MAMDRRQRTVLAINLRAHREAGGLSMRELERRSGVDESQISRIESGRSGARPRTIEMIERGLGVSAGTLARKDAQGQTAFQGVPTGRARFTAARVARELGVSSSTVYGWHRNGRLRGFRLGGRVFFHRQDVDMLLRYGSVKPGGLLDVAAGSVRGPLRRADIYDAGDA